MKVHMSTMPSKVFASFCSASFTMSVRATACSASGGHGENQSMVEQLMRDGNWRMRFA